MLLWDVEGYGELRFTCRAGPGFHVARHGGRHLHFGLYRTSKKGGSFVEKKRVAAHAKHDDDDDNRAEI